MIEASQSISTAAPTSINMPDHGVRQERWYQLYVRLARPTLDWITAGGVAYHLILQPWLLRSFDVVACGLALTWAAAVYGVKTYEKKAGVS